MINIKVELKSVPICIKQIQHTHSSVKVDTQTWNYVSDKQNQLVTNLKTD